MNPLALPIAVALVCYVALMFAIGAWSQRRVHDVEDFVVAGRRLGLGLATFTLIGTWFGAGTLLATTDEVRATGLQAAGLDPIGAGVCLILAGVLFARHLWSMKLLTIADFFRVTYGPRAEVLSALLTIPAFLGWIAAQFVGLAGVLDVFLGIDPSVGLALVAVVGVAYTLAGGMWAVTLTDAIQLSLLALGLIVMTVTLMLHLGDGSASDGVLALFAATPPEHLVLVPTERLPELVGWLSLFAAGALGNLPGQDLWQRVFASRSAEVARGACIIGGVVYIALGALPLTLGLAGNLLAPDHADEGTVALLAGLFLTPAMAVLFVVTLVSAVLSTIDSALLAPATTLAQNVFAKLWPNANPLRANRAAVAIIAAISLAVAYMGESAYALLESSYEVGLVSLLAPMALGVWAARRSEAAALVAMVLGTGVWAAHMVLGAEGFGGFELAPVGLTSFALAVLAFLVVARSAPRAA